MITLRMLGIGCYVLTFAVVLLFVLMYLWRDAFMPYHQQAVRRPWHEIDPSMQQLLLALIHALGFAWLAWLLCCVFLLNILLSSPFNPGIWLLFQSLILFSLVAPVLVASGLRRRTDAKTPIAGGVAAALLSTLGFTLMLMS